MNGYIQNFSEKCEKSVNLCKIKNQTLSAQQNII